jgi:putative redox protein
MGLLETSATTARNAVASLPTSSEVEQPGAMVHRIEKAIDLIGALDEVQRTRLMEIADRCPVHRTLTSRIEIQSALVAAPG